MLRIFSSRICLCAVFFFAAASLYGLFAQYYSPIFFTNNNGPFFGSDTIEIADTMRRVVGYGDLRRHPLFSVVTAPIVDIFQAILGCQENAAIIFTIAFCGATVVASAWWVLSRALSSYALAACLTGLYALMFTNVVFFSIPETYVVSCCAIVLCFGAFLTLLDKSSWWVPAIFGALIGIAALCNPPLLSLALVPGVYWLSMGPLVHTIARSTILAVSAAVVSGTYYWIFYTVFFPHDAAGFQGDWVALNSMTSVQNLYDGSLYSFVFINFFVASVITPSEVMRPVLRPADLAGFTTNITTVSAVALYAAVFLVSLISLIRHRDRLLVPICIWFACLGTFHVYFNPNEALLYSPQVLFPLVLLLGRALSNIRCRSAWKIAPLIFLMILMIANNAPVLLRFSYGF